MTLADANTGIKRCWWLINNVLNKAKDAVIPPLLENGPLIYDFSSKAQILMTTFIFNVFI